MREEMGRDNDGLISPSQSDRALSSLLLLSPLLLKGAKVPSLGTDFCTTVCVL